MTIKIGIDPGHGGADPGSIGRHLGLKEKDINLAVALILKDRLVKMEIEPILTRETDKYISLGERAALFNQHNVDLVVSIHVNSAKDPDADYISTFIVGKGGHAEKAAAVIQKEIVAAVGWTDGGVRVENFYILRQTHAPSVLVEMGFISNQQQESQLAIQSTQEKFAEGIAKGIATLYGIAERPVVNTDYHGHWAEESIRRALELKLMSGYPDGSFKPDQQVTRAELATALVNLYQSIKG